MLPVAVLKSNSDDELTGELLQASLPLATELTQNDGAHAASLLPQAAAFLQASGQQGLPSADQEATKWATDLPIDAHMSVAGDLAITGTYQRPTGGHLGSHMASQSHSDANTDSHHQAIAATKTQPSHSNSM